MTSQRYGSRDRISTTFVPLRAGTYRRRLSPRLTGKGNSHSDIAAEGDDVIADGGHVMKYGGVVTEALELSLTSRDDCFRRERV